MALAARGREWHRVAMTGEGPLEDTLEAAPRSEVVGARYEVLTLLGGGAMGVVYEAHDFFVHRR